MKILVTGTTGGIGGAVKAAALKRGWEVVEVNRAEWERGLDAGSARGLDAAVFATGTCEVKPLAKTTDADFAETVRVNCGLFVALMRRLVAERLYGESGMTVVAVSSVSAAEGWAGGIAYCASKGALSAAARAMDAELGGRGIRVRVVEPRYVKTRMFDNCAGRMGVDPRLAQAPEELAEEILAMVCETRAVSHHDSLETRKGK